MDAWMSLAGLWGFRGIPLNRLCLQIYKYLLFLPFFGKLSINLIFQGILGVFLRLWGFGADKRNKKFQTK
jgi:hypothetical protein